MAALLALACWAGAAQAQPALGRFRIDPEKITVSGISSGGYMAVQLGVAHSATFSGVGVFAAGPYGCADTGGSTHSNATRALGPCMAGRYGTTQRWLCTIGLATCPGPDAPDVEASVRRVHGKALRNEIDPVSNLARQRVFLLSGKEDRTVETAVVDALMRFYARFATPERIARVARPGLSHTFPTEAFRGGNACTRSDPPFVSDCDYDGAKEVLWHLYGPLEAHAGEAQTGTVREFDQAAFFPAAGDTGMARSGYVYVPASCSSGSPCGLHVALHGCGQAVAQIGKAFVEGAGYNRWAETNRLVVLYPQVLRTDGFFSENPKGCWDWWGYTGPGWDDRRGAQMRAIVAMVDHVRQPAP